MTTEHMLTRILTMTSRLARVTSLEVHRLLHPALGDVLVQAAVP